MGGLVPEWLQYFDIGQRTVIIVGLIYVYLTVVQMRNDFEGRISRIEDVLMDAPKRKHAASGAE